MPCPFNCVFETLGGQENSSGQPRFLKLDERTEREVAARSDFVPQHVLGNFVGEPGGASLGIPPSNRATQYTTQKNPET